MAAFLPHISYMLVKVTTTPRTPSRQIIDQLMAAPRQSGVELTISYDSPVMFTQEEIESIGYLMALIDSKEVPTTNAPEVLSPRQSSSYDH